MSMPLVSSYFSLQMTRILSSGLKQRQDLSPGDTLKVMSVTLVDSGTSYSYLYDDSTFGFMVSFKGGLFFSLEGKSPSNEFYLEDGGWR